MAVRGRKQKCHNNAFWQLEMNYNQIKELEYEKKVDKISSICSSKYFDEGHIARIDFLKFLEEKGDVPLDIFNQDNNHNFKNYRGPLTQYKDKSKGYVPYKYYFMVENNYEENFITEKIWEPILCETLVFYYGCPNVKDYIDERAYVQLDMNDFEKSYQIIKTAIEEDWWSQRIDIIRKEKKKILNELSFFPTIEKIITKVEGLLIVFAVYSGNDDQSECIAKCKKRVREVYPNARIVFVDNNSKNEKWKDKDEIIIVNNSKYRYEMGAYRKALEYYRADEYLFLQGSVFINKTIDYKLKKNEIDAKQMQIFKGVNVNEELFKLIKEIAQRLNLKGDNWENLNCVLACNFYCNNLFVEEMIKDNLFNIECINKDYSCAFERILGLYMYLKLGEVLPIDDKPYTWISINHGNKTVPSDYKYVMYKIWLGN